MANKTGSGQAAYALCVPHLPFITIQPRELNTPFWSAYEKQAAALRDFDPEIGRAHV